MRDYHDLYLKSDVLLLADVLKTFVKYVFSLLTMDLIPPGAMCMACSSQKNWTKSKFITRSRYAFNV